MSSKSKTKGSSYERAIAKYLSDLYKESFVRVPNSGAYTGGANSHRKLLLDNKQAKTFKGDIVAPDSWPNFNAECKNYSEFPFHLLFTEECRQFESWIEQLLNAGNPDDVNILFIKISRKGEYVAVQVSEPWDTQTNVLWYCSKKHGDWMIYSFDNFFKLNTHQLKKLSNRKILLETLNIL